MTVPTSGSYSGVDIYQSTDITRLGGAVGTALTALEQVATDTGVPVIANLIADLVAVYQPVETGSDVSFDGTTITSVSDAGDLLTLSDAEVDQMGPNAFSFASGGTGYLLSNGAVDGLSVDQALSAVLAVLDGNTLTQLTVAPLVTALKTAIDAQNLGDAIILPGSFFSGQPYNPPCFVRGTRIATVHGDVAVEDLAEGDEVLLARGGSAPVVWIGRRRTDLATRGSRADTLPVRIDAGALGDGLPLRTLRVSFDHALYLDGVLVPAGLLVNGSSIVVENPGRVEYFHVELPSHDILLAEGAAAESYLDTGNRAQFGNCTVNYDPLDASKDACAEMVLAGSRLDAIRAMLKTPVPA